MLIKKVILSRPKMVFDTRCPKCKHEDIGATPIANFVCGNCKTKYEQDVEMNILQASMKKIIQLLGYNNTIYVQGECDERDTWTAEELVKRRARQSEEVLYNLMACRDIFKKQLCYIVSDISIVEDIDYRTHCLQCGYCNSCVTCKQCQSHYTPKNIKGVRRYTCPECGSKLYTKTYFKKHNKDKCPLCNSDSITLSKFSTEEGQCPYCKETAFAKPRKVKVYRLEISHHDRDDVEEANRKKE